MRHGRMSEAGNMGTLSVPMFPLRSDAQASPTSALHSVGFPTEWRYINNLGGAPVGDSTLSFAIKF